MSEEKSTPKYYELILIRGCWGTGKSTMGQTICRERENFVHFEDDMYFTNALGEYKYDASKLSEAKEACFDKVKQALINWHNVVVTNTFEFEDDIRKYFDLAYRLGKICEVRVHVIRLRTEFGTTHEIPPHVINSTKMHMASWFGEEVIE